MSKVINVLENLDRCAVESQSVDWGRRRRFSELNERHRSAMVRMPYARAMELEPLIYLMPKGRAVFWDLFAGTGFVSKELGGHFAKSILIDDCTQPLEIGGGVVNLAGDACAPATLAGLPKADMAVCLAGFHHVLANDGKETDREATTALRINVLKNWRNQLMPGGRLVVVDVPGLGAAHGDVFGEALSPEFRYEEKVHLGGGGRRSVLFPQAEQNLGDYLSRLGKEVHREGLNVCEPSLFFDEVVARYSRHGHLAEFSHPLEMMKLLKSAGYCNVRVFVAYAPWLFASKAEAVWFIQELLGLELDDGMRELYAHTPLRQLSDDSWGLAWKLMYAVGDRS